jgi:hypothetical protein
MAILNHLYNPEFQVDHLVMLEHENRVLVAAKTQDSCDLLFLVNSHTGDVYVRQDNSWLHLFESESRSVIAHMLSARNQGIATYRRS